MFLAGEELFGAVASELGHTAQQIAGDTRGGLNLGRIFPPARGYGKPFTVFYETTIPKLGIGTRESHRFSANLNLLEDLKADAGLKAAADEFGVVVPTTQAGLPTSDSIISIGGDPWVWHHDPYQPGVMQLVPASQHKWGTFEYDLMHYFGIGGFKIWGRWF